MPRNNFQEAFANLAQQNLPPYLSIKEFAPNCKLHPRITEGGGYDNAHTVFGLIQPAAHGKTMIVQVSEATERMMEHNDPQAIAHLQEELLTAVTLWDTKAVPHDQANAKVVVL